MKADNRSGSHYKRYEYTSNKVLVMHRKVDTKTLNKLFSDSWPTDYKSRRSPGLVTNGLITIVVRVFNNLGLKMYTSLSSRVPLNIPHFQYFAATGKLYTHHIEGIVPYHMHISDLCHLLGQTNWKKLAAFLKTGSQTFMLLQLISTLSRF